MEMDFTLCGGFNPRLKDKIFYRFTITNYSILKIMYQIIQNIFN